MNFPTHQEPLSAGQCPLCEQPNDCQLCTVTAYKGPCWCAKVEIPDNMLAQVPPDLRNKTCICRGCVESFHCKTPTNQNVVLPGDFYFENGLMVFTEQHHLRRGYCCDNNCRHCPYHNAPPRKPLFPK